MEDGSRTCKGWLILVLKVIETTLTGDQEVGRHVGYEELWGNKGDGTHIGKVKTKGYQLLRWAFHLNSWGSCREGDSRH